VTVTVLGLAGSQRRGGNTETLLDWCLEGAGSEGAAVVKMALSELDLHGCRACDACRKTGVCVQTDDMQALYPYLREADSIVIAAPIYFQGMPALPKMVIDRCQPLWVLKYVLKRPIAEPGCPERRGAFLSCAGMDSMQAFGGSKKVMRALWYTLDVTPTGEVLCPGMDAKGQIRESVDAQAAAEQLGRELGRERPSRERKDAMEAGTGTCGNCGTALADRVEEEERTGVSGSRSTGECSTYRVWFCPNSDCVMYKTDLYREPIADRTDRPVN
jgi:multimeric flavodoxin WrbA